LDGLTSKIFTMSKGNLFLGQGRGSVGDVVFYRANGQQLARSRNRSPRNPKTDAQILQRAISSTVVQAYKAGKVIFDHAFEGKEVPAGCQRRFLSVNMRRLRAAVISELETPDTEANARVASPGTTYPVPWSYRISEGSLVQNLFEITAVTEGQDAGMKFKMVAAQEGETVAQYAARLNLAAGEIYTLVGFAVNNEKSGANDLICREVSFGFSRLIMKDVSSSTTAMSAATYGDFFTIDTSGAQFPLDTLTSANLDILQIVPNATTATGSIGVIRSNENSGLRSTSDMVCPRELSEDFENIWGVAPIHLFEAWSRESSGLQSPLILEGGGF
jgi:hypothetical protein